MGVYRTSIIWRESTEDFQSRVNRCYSIAELLRSYGMAIGAPNYKTVRRRILEEGIDTSHIPIGHNCRKGVPSFSYKPASEFFYVGSKINTSDLKRKLFREKYLENKCAVCGLEPVWEGKPLSLQLDHINGDRDDNRLENLRILCPNCHAQTATFSGKHKARKHQCETCGKSRGRSKFKRCQSCANRESSKANEYFYQPRRFDPTKEELEKLVWEKPTTQIAKDFGVSDVAVAKRCKRLGIQKPPRGHWMKAKQVV